MLIMLKWMMHINGNVLDNDTDPEGDTQMVDAASPLSGPSNGTVTMNPDGTFTYTPNAGYIGTDQFVYEIFDNDGQVATDLATVYILIGQTPAPAIAIVKEGTLNDNNQSGCSDPGETITYTFTVTNRRKCSFRKFICDRSIIGSAKSYSSHPICFRRYEWRHVARYY